MASTTIISCTCKHEYQDKVYGTNKRLANMKFNLDKATCTVCGKEVTIRTTPKK